MNKKIIIILIIIALIIASITGILIITTKTEKNDFSNERISKTESERFEESKEELNDVSEELVTTEIQDEPITEEVIEETPKGEITTTKNITPNKEQVVLTKSVQTEPIKASNVNTPKEETKEEKISQPVVETKNTEQKTKTETIQETKPSVPQCTDTKHGMDVGNSGKWFNSKQEAINYNDSIQKTWGDKWESFEIDDDTYDKNCPYRYDVWTCPFCGKWTINFYYRK